MPSGTALVVAALVAITYLGGHAVETYFDKFVCDEKHPEKQPVAGETRRFRDESADELNARLAGLPSGADLDAVAEEENLRHSTDGQELLKDFENHKADAVDDEAADAQKAVAEHTNPPQGAE